MSMFGDIASWALRGQQSSEGDGNGDEGTNGENGGADQGPQMSAEEIRAKRLARMAGGGASSGGGSNVGSGAGGDGGGDGDGDGDDDGDDGGKKPAAASDGVGDKSDAMDVDSAQSSDAAAVKKPALATEPANESAAAAASAASKAAEPIPSSGDEAGILPAAEGAELSAPTLPSLVSCGGPLPSSCLPSSKVALISLTQGSELWQGAVQLNPNWSNALARSSVRWLCWFAFFNLYCVLWKLTHLPSFRFAVYRLGTSQLPNFRL
mmetsp:Transcript_19384/g.36226  ORF Transcript_19384/g.36226 Transcript_19384/m.36226 type:complete len:265 (-) Transcript_19384:711-1505(-)